ncbi:YicC family protein [Geochorda subterranea]|uniref:DUF1732 domain-containing protein n=1 Tax=Geochorda subterranea TaxID=3109564 RepID=A0ABZ1BLE5_9FIRM|nr:DUF1732 domain-containing protein [Limnochorda sp. LNt]WRP13395.1 DUF1732 domain-containing protein [Limnochorda sp. LNt]
MTGFGTARGPSPWGTLEVAIRTLNHRCLDVSCHWPRGWPSLDPRVRDRVAARLVRGRVEVSVVAQELETARRSVRVNAAVLRRYWQQLTQIQQEIGSSVAFSVADLLVLPEVVSVDETPPEEDALWEALAPLVDAALDQVERMRRVEGTRLWQETAARLDAVEAALGRLREQGGQWARLHQQRLEQRLAGLLAGSALITEGRRLLEDEAFRQRLAQEVAIAADKADVSEELDRLAEHVAHMRQLAAEPAPGRRMEFLLREMDRELSTATAKVAQAEAVHRLIELRAEVERMREQIANFE